MFDHVLTLFNLLDFNMWPYPQLLPEIVFDMEDPQNKGIWLPFDMEDPYDLPVIISKTEEVTDPSLIVSWG